MAKEVSLKPYTGRMFVARTMKDYSDSHLDLFKEPDVIQCSDAGKMTGGCGNDGKWTYLIYGKTSATLAHEVSHVILHVFERAGIDPRECGGEPFCYMLGYILDQCKRGS